MQKLSFAILLLCSYSKATMAQATEAIRLNQIGFYPKAIKHAIIVGNHAKLFYVIEATRHDTVLKASLQTAIKSPFSEKYTQLADFSSLQQQGKFYLYVPSLGYSYAFVIAPRVHEKALQAAVKGYYFQRASTALPKQYAGKWARKMGHPDTQVLVHASAASATRPAGTKIASPRGWYDAGDYNKYIVNSGITMGTLLATLEDYPTIVQRMPLNIPESRNALPDMLDEILWNLRWMLTMQDPADGGVYHKLTNAAFDGMQTMPAEATKERYVVQKNTIASLDFAAVMAQAARVLRPYRKTLPLLADSCQQAAIKALQWATANPHVYYTQDANNKAFAPAITTGGYEDRQIDDEWFWASAELYVLTQQEEYAQTLQKTLKQSIPIPTWNHVQALGYYTLLKNAQVMSPKLATLLEQCQNQLLATADALLEGQEKQLYHTVFGKTTTDFVWGSTAHAANQGVLLLQAFRQTKAPKYLQAALANLDYLLGRNGTGYCFLTGLGSKSPQHPHHRLSEADGVQAPVPGLLVGGPNPSQQDHCVYASSVADESYSDHVCSFASNEIAINWNAPLVYLLAGIEQHYR